ncbi:phosphoethanolamine--lipid A transferase [Polaromonas sp.]|uniref:phosphoethanolamine transferase n=1 Tax=Polaromonas sp. TaxID=1869339 RepID=UPI00286CD271|nr:phosphoethanolamine--lipid A transferase [Polaromonas sp.]
MHKPAVLLPISSRPLNHRSRRPTLQAETLVLLCVGFLLLAGNGPFWRAALMGRGWDQAATWGFAAALFVSFSAFYFAFVALLATRLSVKPLLTVLVLCTAFASWYMDHYAIYLDRAMLRNVLATNVQEARELLVWGMVPHLLLLGALPVALLWWPQLKRRRLRRAVALRLASVVGALVIGVACLLLVFADFASLMRNHREVRYLLTPGNVVVALASNAWGSAKRPDQPKIAVGADARLGAAWSSRARPALFVLVVGETARAQNFSLNGYARPTNPLLAKQDVISFSHVTACGTSTEVSLPCMFSPFGRAQYDEDKIRSHESLLHVLARAGFKVLWRDNQSGCKGVCEGLPTEQMDHASIEALCAEGQCLDEVLLQGMEGIARDAQGNLLVVMHQLGSHGPAYYKRYPAVFKRFSPACENEDLRGCSSAEIVNAYDNSLLYTDYFLSGLIDFLGQAEKKYDTAMLYVSDHGESLGDNGLYLHGVPYPIAPDVQKRVPLVMWLSPGFRRSFHVDQDCLRARAGAELSHDNLFHSVLGVLDVQTQAYNGALDLFAPCRPAPALARINPPVAAR